MFRGILYGTWEIQTQLKSAVLLLHYIRVSCIVSEPHPQGSGSETISCTGSYNFTGIAHLRKLLIETLQSHMKPLKCLGIQQNTEDTN